MKEDDVSLPPHMLVVGHGRSGTNMVLDLLDCHRRTFCRNEPNELWGSAFTGLGDAMFGDPVADDFAGRWQEAVMQSMRSNGARDRFGTEKDYFRGPLRARLGQAVMARGRLRAQLLPRQAGRTVEEWPCPTSYYDSAALDRALPVLKILLAPAWVSRAHDLFPSQRVVHVLRAPEGFIQSWWNRYVTGIGGGPEKVFADNHSSLIRILNHFGRTDEMPPRYSQRALVISELWRWRYMNEVLIDRLSDRTRYLRVPYSDIMQDRLAWAEKLYAFAGLEMADEVRTRVVGMQNTLFARHRSDRLAPNLVADAVAEVTSDSRWRSVLVPATPG